MSDSDFIFERDDPIHVGSPVENDFVYSADVLVSDGDISDFAFIRDRGFGFMANWEAHKTSGFDGTIRINEDGKLVEVEHSGSNTSGGGTGAGGIRQDAISTPWDIEFTNVQYTEDDRNNNRTIGAINDNDAPNIAASDGMIAWRVEESTSSDVNDWFLLISDGNGTRVRSSTIQLSSGVDLRLKYDGGTLEGYADGSKVREISGDATNIGMYPALTLEDDPDVSDAATVSFKNFVVR